MGQGSFRRLPRFSFRLVLLDEQHDVRADGDALFRGRFGVRPGPGHQALADNRAFTVVASLLLMALLVILNIVGLGVGKWINNIGGIGTGSPRRRLIGLGVIMCSRFGTTITAADFRIPANPRFVLNAFGVICFGLVGLELASVMGDEIQDPQRTCRVRLPGAECFPACSTSRRR